jgi:rubredoxin
VKTIATFSKPEEAHLFRTRLEAAGIPAYVQDEHFIQMDWLYSNAIGGVRVQIADEDLAAAREFLAADSPQPSPEAVDVICPKCGSCHTAPDERFRRISFLSLLLISFPLLLARHRWRCTSCGHLFRSRPTANA